MTASPLPYGPRLRRFLRPLWTAFVAINRPVVGLMGVGFGALASNPATGYLMVLRTTGRRTGLRREVALGYVVLDGAVYCCAGFGPQTGWYRNLVADPAVEVVLPGRTMRGLASVVEDPAEWTRSYRAFTASLGVLGRAIVGDIRGLDDDVLRADHGALPMVRIVPTAFVAGPLDPGGRFWLVPALGTVGLALELVAARWVRRRDRRIDRVPHERRDRPG